jgi:hypothetical protein
MPLLSESRIASLYISSDRTRASWSVCDRIRWMRKASRRSLGAGVSAHGHLAMICRASVSSTNSEWFRRSLRTRKSVAAVTTSSWKKWGNPGTRRSVGAPGERVEGDERGKAGEREHHVADAGSSRARPVRMSHGAMPRSTVEKSAKLSAGAERQRQPPRGGARHGRPEIDAGGRGVDAREETPS